MAPRAASRIGPRVLDATFRRNETCLRQHLVDVGADQGGRDEPEERQRRVAPADVGAVDEDAPEAVLCTQLLQQGAFIRDGDEMLTLRGEAPEVLEVRKRLDGGAGLAGDQEQRLFQVKLAGQVKHGIGVRGIEDRQLQHAGGCAEGALHDLGSEA